MRRKWEREIKQRGKRRNKGKKWSILTRRKKMTKKMILTSRGKKRIKETSDYK